MSREKREQRTNVETGATAARTAGPWMHMAPMDEELHPIVSEKINANGNWTVATCGNGTDAAFIVQACNAHEDLVAALREIDGTLCNRMLSPIEQGNTVLRTARAALAKAGA